MLPGAQDCISDSQLVDLCSRLFVDVQWVDLPPGNSGINVCYGDRRTIFVRKAEFPGLREHVLLHELREIFEYKFRELGHPLAKNDIEQRAEAFAVLVRMRSATAAWFTFFEYADNLQSPWQRIAACILVAAGAMVNLICTAMAGPLLDSSAATSCSFAD